MKSPIKYHGGKSYLAKRIVALMPKHYMHYVEPYFGGGSVLFEKPQIGSEVVNDLDFNLTTFWGVMGNPADFELFKRKCEGTPMSQVVYDSCVRTLSNGDTLKVLKDRGDVWLQAWAFFVVARQSMSGRMRSFTPLTRKRLRRGINAEASAWWTAVDGLEAVHQRLSSVVVLNADAEKVIEQQDDEDTLFYLDPPYLESTRTASSVYEHEMTVKQHMSLLDTLCCLQGKFMLSGYSSELYEDYASDNSWNKVEIKQPNHSAKSGTKRIMTECLWMNY